MKKAWLITHDNYIDRRIFFFAEVLESQGYNVKLFPAYSSGLQDLSDPPYVIRPEVTHIVKEYDVQKEELADVYSKILTKIINEQDAYFEIYNAYTNKIKLDREMIKGFKVLIHTYERMYTITIECKTCIIFYSSLSEAVQKIITNGINGKRMLYQCSEVEKSLFEFIKLEDVGLNQIVTFNQFNVVKYVGSSGNEMIRLQNYQDYTTYDFDIEEGKLYKVINEVCDFNKLEIIENQTFDFNDFKNNIFNYSPILTTIKKHLLNEKPDLVYVADLPTLPIGVMLKETTACRLIIDCHEWWKRQSVLWEPENVSKINLIDKYEQELYRKCDIRITVGEMLAEEMSKYFEVHFDTIYSCISKELKPDKDVVATDFWSNKFGIPIESRIALFQGSLTTLRNLDNLARATRYLKENQYLVICGGGAYESEFKQILESEGDINRVIFAGWIPQADLMSYTMNGHVGVLPYVSIDDYFALSVPNKLMEYFEAQLPMICDASLKEIAKVTSENNVGIIVDCSEPKELGCKISEILCDLDRINNIKNNYNRCKSKFSFVEQEEKFIEILCNIIS